MKKFLWMSVFVGCAFPILAQSPKNRLIDSLENACVAETNVSRRVDILLNLKDLNDGAEKEMDYSRRLFREACDAEDGFAVGASLGSLAAHYIGDPESRDSLDTLLHDAEPLLRKSSMEGLDVYYRMVRFARRLQSAATEESVQLCRTYLDSIRQCPEGNVYEQAAHLFLQGVIAYRLASAEGQMQMERGLPYWTDELALLGKMKPTARRNFHANLITCLIAAYGSTRDQKALVRAADGYLSMLDEYYRDPEIVRRRPYIAKEMSYLVCYYTMCFSPFLDRRTSHEYYERYRRFVQTAAADPNNILINKNGFYSISANYFSGRGDYEQAMAYNDSLIMLTRPGGMSSLLVGMYDRRAKLLEHMDRYKEACGVYNEMAALRDSLSKHEYAERVGELEVQYGLDKAERDKALLLAQKRQNTLYFTFAILILAVAGLVYLWRNLIHVNRLQHELSVESQRAQESDRLKRDFMGSMSHEVRTPLNAIIGFAELIAGGELTQEEYVEFAQIIRENSQLFTSLINDMLEVSQLDNTSAELPKQQMDICKLFSAELEHLPVQEGVECRLVLAEQEIVVPIHKGYVAMLIRELLKNALKFTVRGSVTLECGRVEDGVLTFMVTDTGCGVAAESAERIFERFFKLDPFSQGLGLGLSLCRLIVEKSGGTIYLDTSYTEGARFVVKLSCK